MAIKKINGWTSYHKYFGIDFGIEFSRNLVEEEYFSFVKEYLEASHKYKICRIETEGNYQLYFDYLIDCWNRIGLVRPSYLPGFKHYSAQFYGPFTQLSFYEDNRIVQRDVTHLANYCYDPVYITIEENCGYHFYKVVQLDKIQYCRHVFKEPIEITLPELIKGKHIKFNDLVGSVRCDIWLDTVRNFTIWDRETKETFYLEEHDNTELAMLNTPRLNSFFKSLKQLAEKYDGKWFFETDLKVVDEHAILINGRVLYAD